MILRIGIAHHQICVFVTGLDSPYNDWTEVQSDQGFSWTADSVSFGTLDSSGLCVTTVTAEDQVSVRADAIRVIQVPFKVGEAASVTVGSPTSTEISVSMPSGSYCLVFQTGYLGEEASQLEDSAFFIGVEEDTMWCELRFVPSDNCEPAILRADEGLKPPTRLDMTASRFPTADSGSSAAP